MYLINKQILKFASSIHLPQLSSDIDKLSPLFHVCLHEVKTYPK